MSRGFVYVRESEDLLEEAHTVVADAVEDCLDRHVNDWGKIKNIIKDSLSDFLWKRMKQQSGDPADHYGSVAPHGAAVRRQQDLHCGGLGVSTVRGSDRGMDYE